MYANMHNLEPNFDITYLVFLRLYPYKQSPLKKSSVKNLKNPLYGPYWVIMRVGEVAYELEILEGRKIHNTLHVSCLKKALGQHVTSSTDLPLLDEEGQLVLELERIVDVWEKRMSKKGIQEYLVIWKGFPAEYVAWEGK
jgi:hypothetical protein